MGEHLCETASIGAGVSQKIYLLFLYIILSVKRWSGKLPSFKKHKKIKIQWEGKIATFYIKHQIDLDILRETFVDNQYEIDNALQPKVIVDLGSNIGATVLKFHLQYPGAIIYAFEPDPNNFEWLKLNTAAFSDKVILDERPISGISGKKVKFYTGSQYHWSSSLLNREGKTDNFVQRTTLSIDDMIKEYKLDKIDMLKCDIEGAEEDAFKHCTKWDNINYIIGELHPKLITLSADDFFSLFPNFTLLALDTKSWVFKLKNQNLP